jgi:translation elongation factor EF-4
VDFSYEVSRSLQACQGALLLVDATQGVQAQTVANFYLAFEQNLTVIPIINKIDMPTADPKRVAEQMARAFDIDPDDILLISAKSGLGVPNVLSTVVKKLPPPPGRADGKLQALLFDCYYDEYKGVICLVEVINGKLYKGERISSKATGLTYEVLDVGVLHAEPRSTGVLHAGQVRGLGHKGHKGLGLGQKDTPDTEKQWVTRFGWLMVTNGLNGH